MFFHKKELIAKEVKVNEPNAQFAQFLLEQFGGATGELTAALQYWVQSFHVENQGIKDMLQDIAIEEFGHLEMVGKLIEAHTKGAKQAGQEAAFNSSLFAVRGVGPHFLDSQGSAWTAAYLNEGGNVVRDLRANIGAEAGARQTYESLIKIAPDSGTKEALVHLLTREISHTQMFMKALDSMGKLTDPMFGNVQPDDTVDIYYNLSTGGSEGSDDRGPWNADETFRYIADPMKEVANGQQETAEREMMNR
ncbi:MAG: manganese catalase family protein [Leptolyngbyaceae cyanobacterium SM1_1_3]|nr:manganese catalase family protein [Leptolyngbyaceae cyanobacterium SM1_1_3]NJN04586.1 manganese catalase family protein [Leptolyngbyaceae cyanobacterium RM1_1_2]NJO11415.1 manganese catalase family protein [Leptolyngbyaceae cyanobacterium SL_1_1]